MPTKPINTLEGFPLYVDPTDRAVSRALKNRGSYEPATMKVLKKYLKEGSTFFDVGAHIGYFTVAGSRLVGDKGKVMAFEPFERNFTILRNNVLLNKAVSVTLVQVALSDAEGEGELHISPTNSGDGRMFPCAGHMEKQPVLCMPLDKLHSRTPVDLIKVDVQGWEIRVVKGMLELLKLNCPRGLRVLIEYWPYGLRAAGESPLELFVLMESAGYKVCGTVPLLEEKDERKFVNVLFSPGGKT